MTIKEINARIAKIDHQLDLCYKTAFDVPKDLGPRLDTLIDLIINTPEKTSVMPANVLIFDQNKRSRILNNRVYKKIAQVIKLKG